MEIKIYIKYFVNYGIPIIALLISILAYIDSKKVSKVQLQLNKVEEELMQYKLEEKKKELEESTKACVEARVYKEF